MIKNILLCGVGGQGIVLTSKLIASASMEKGLEVMSAETIGMAQKGGSVFSFLRLAGSDERIYSPMFAEGQADLIIAFEPAEAVRMLPYLRDSGAVIVNSTPVMPVTAALRASDYSGAEMIGYLRENVDNVSVIDGSSLCRSIGSPRVLNMLMLGAAASGGYLPFTINDAVAAMKRTVKPQFAQLNEKALRSFE
ncbi:MAG: indolepyruvate oxidoreductase subunit beta [Ruminococcus sp.]|nr:indolepyruvate oxidoreductase subunit beta [Ruminococcus sp.]